MEGGGAGPSSEQAALALLQAVLRRDEAAVRAALAAGAPLAFNGVGALHIEALADWAEGVRLLLDAGETHTGRAPRCAQAVHAQPAPLVNCPRRVPSLSAGAKLDVHESFGYRDEEAAAPLGLTAGQEAALGESWMVRTPLQVAILSGAASAAAALLAAETRAEQDRPIFRHSSQYFSLLPALAQRTAKEAGATAAEEAVPAALQQMCSVPAGGLPPGHAARDAYTSAVQLAFPPAPARAPGPVPPRWDWLLQHLLQLHTSGQLGAEHATAVASAVDALARLSAEDPRAEAAAVQWLRVPAAAGLTPPQLDSMLQQGLAGEALSALLAHPAARQALLERAQVRPCDQRAAAPISLVATAASTELPEVLDAVLAAGGAVTLNDVNLLATARGWASNPGALALLLSRGVPPVPVEAPAGQEVPWGVCPIYAVLQMVNDELAYVSLMLCCIWVLCRSVAGRTASRRRLRYVCAASCQASHCCLPFLHTGVDGRRGRSSRGGRRAGAAHQGSAHDRNAGRRRCAGGRLC